MENITCDDLRRKFEAIPEDDDIGRLDFRSDSRVIEHLRSCPVCRTWVTDHLKKFIKE